MLRQLASLPSRAYARLSVGSKLLIVAASIALVTSSATSWSVYQTQASQIREDFEERALLIAHTVEATTAAAQEQYGGTQLPLELHEPLRELTEKEPSILLINVYTVEQGAAHVIGSSDAAAVGATPVAESREDIELVGATGVFTEEEDLAGQNAYQIVAPLQLEGQAPLAIGVHLATADRDDALAAVQRTFAFSILIGMVIALFIVYVIVRLLVARPLQRLARAVERMGEGAYATRVQGTFSADAGDEIIAMSAHFNEMAQSIEDLHEQMKGLASTDPLTGLYNRRTFLEALQREMERARRDGRPLAAVMLDLDAFKTVNDRYGHTVGDMALQHIAKALESAARASDLTARFGGDEFTVLLPNCDRGSLQRVMERIRLSIEELAPPRSGDDRPIRVTASAGGALFRHDDTIDSLMQRADLALFAAKSAGRNQVRLAA